MPYAYCPTDNQYFMLDEYGETSGDTPITPCPRCGGGLVWADDYNPSVGDKVIMFKLKSGNVGLRRGFIPNVGDRVVKHQVNTGEWVTHGKTHPLLGEKLIEERIEDFNVGLHGGGAEIPFSVEDIYEQTAYLAPIFNFHVPAEGRKLPYYPFWCDQCSKACKAAFGGGAKCHYYFIFCDCLFYTEVLCKLLGGKAESGEGYQKLYVEVRGPPFEDNGEGISNYKVWGTTWNCYDPIRREWGCIPGDSALQMNYDQDNNFWYADFLNPFHTPVFKFVLYLGYDPYAELGTQSAKVDAIQNVRIKIWDLGD